MTETYLQYQCFTAFTHKYHPEQYGRLISTFQNSNTGRQGKQKKAIGLVAGVSDMLYFPPFGGTIPIEIKVKGTRHDKAHVIHQCEWIISVHGSGYFALSVDGFMACIDGTLHDDKITAHCMLKMCKECKGSKILIT
jgi:hypothetical protein